MPCVQYAFGLFNDRMLLGVVTYGPPSSPNVGRSILGGMFESNVYELNRLCVDCNIKNSTSVLVGRSLKMMPKPSCIVSYADGGQGHVGYIYQATNFIFTGAVRAHDSEYIVNGTKTHPRTLASRGITSPKKWAVENDVLIIEPKPKNRYVYFCGNRREIKAMRNALRYEVQPYPKGETKRYDANAVFPTQQLLF